MSDITKKYVDYAGLQEYDSQIKGVISTDFVGATSSADGAAGRVPAPESGDENKFLRGDGTWAAPAAGSVTGVKGNAESTYRDGDVNITPANIGLGNVGNYKSVSTVADQGLTVAEQENARTNIGALDERVVPITEVWLPKAWEGLTEFFGSNVWKDGDNIYMSKEDSHYVLNKATSEWEPKIWYGNVKIWGASIWTDGDNIYHSYPGFNSYVLDRATSTWSLKTWNGLPSGMHIDGRCVWTDGDNIYYSVDTNQYVLDKSTSTWSPKAWNGLSDFFGSGVWTDGYNIYLSYKAPNQQYVLDKTTSTWEPKTWYGLTVFIGDRIWTNKNNGDIYYSFGQEQYVLDKTTDTWVPKTWNGLTEIVNGSTVWTDGVDIYYSAGSDQYVFNELKILGTAATKDVAISGNASESQVVMGNDTRLIGIYMGTATAWGQLSPAQQATYKIVILDE